MSSSTAPATEQQQQQQPLLDRLLRLHLSEGQRKVEWSSHLNPCSNLPTALCKRENPNRLVLTLWPGNEGYTLHLVSKIIYFSDNFHEVNAISPLRPRRRVRK